MSTTVSYKGSTIATATNQTKTLLTQGKYLEGNITVTDVSSGASLGTKIITANGQYDASDEGYDGYSEIDVNVPNTYTQSDEGKVVSNGALVSQTAHADVTPTTSDQTIDTTLNNSLKVKGDADLVAGNIKKDVEIFGVTGSYEGGGGGGSSLPKTGTVTPASRTYTLSFDVGITDTIKNLLVVPTSENPLKSNGLTVYALFANADLFAKSMVLKSNNSGASLLTPSGSTSTTRFTQNGSTITVNSGSSLGHFEAISYTWFAW